MPTPPLPPPQPDTLRLLKMLEALRLYLHARHPSMANTEASHKRSDDLAASAMDGVDY